MKDSQIHIDNDALVKQFIELASIDGISKHERKVADHISNSLKHLGVSFYEDQAGKKIDGNAGNIIARIPSDANKHMPLLLMAHMDTVDHTAELNPVIQDGIIRSSGNTILGGDDRAGIAVILYLLESIHKHNLPHRPLEVIFTVAEELGMLGCLELDFSQLKAKEGYIFDCSRPPGKFVAKTPTAVDLKIYFKGRASHSGVAIENGINAFSMALDVLTHFPVGQVDKNTTANIGTIHGGTAVNVVPETITVTGEIRSFNNQTIEKMCRQLNSDCKKVESQYHGKIDMSCLPAFSGFHLSEKLHVIQKLKRVYKNLSLQPEGLTYYGGSDANVVNGHGIQTVNIGIGVKNPHSYNEEIAVQDLGTTAELLFNLIRI